MYSKYVSVYYHIYYKEIFVFVHKLLLRIFTAIAVKKLLDEHINYGKDFCVCEIHFNPKRAPKMWTRAGALGMSYQIYVLTFKCHKKQVIYFL